MDSPTTFQYISLAIAIWGAGLSTFLAIRTYLRSLRRVRVFFDHIEWVERFQIVVVNTGHRPVTITDVGVRPIAGVSPSEAFPIYPSTEEGKPQQSLPEVLHDGESIRFLMPYDFGPDVYAEGVTYAAYARDAEGKEHITTEIRRFDAKYGQYHSEMR